jgi:hypothetical protein
MEEIIEKWWELFDEAALEKKVVLQTWIYGLFCYIQDSQENGEWEISPFEELFEYANEFMDLSREGLDLLKDEFLNLRLSPLIDEDEFQKNYEKFTEKINGLSLEINITKDVFNGDDLSEDTRKRVLVLLGKIKEDVSQEQPQEQQKRKHRAQTRRIHGRRSLTPIKRKNGRRALTLKR